MSTTPLYSIYGYRRNMAGSLARIHMNSELPPAEIPFAEAIDMTKKELSLCSGPAFIMIPGGKNEPRV